MNDKQTQRSEMNHLHKIIQESEEKFRSLAESAKVLIAIVDDIAGSKYLYVNREWENITGFSKKEAKHMKPIDLVHPDLKKQVLESAAKRANNMPVPSGYELKIITKKGDTRILEFSSTLITFEGQKAFLTTGIDITDRKKAEEKLFETTQMWNNTFDAISDYVSIHSIDYRFVNINEAGCKALGKDKDQIIGRRCYELVHGTTVPIAACPCKNIAKIKKYQKSEFFEHGKYYEVEVWPIKEPDENVKYFSHIVRDITDRKKSESELKSYLSLLKIAEETAHFGSWSVDLATNIVTWSDAVADIHEKPHGYAPLVEEGIRFYAPEWKERIKDVFTDCAQKGIPYDEEMQIITETGKRVWVRTIGRAVKDKNNRIIRVEGSFQDISDKKHQEMALQENSRKLLTLINNLNGFVYRCKFDRDWTMEFMSDGIREITGYPPTDFIDNNIRSFNSIIHPDDRNVVWKDWNAALKRRDYYAGEYRIITSTGAIHWVWERGCGVYDGNTLLALEGFITDITDRKNAEIEQTKTNNILQQLIIVANELTGVESENDVINIIKHAARRLSGADGVTVVLREGDKCHYVDEDAIAPLWKGKQFPLDACVSGWAMLNKTSVIIEDITVDSRIPQDIYKNTFVKSLAITPIRTKNPIGAIGVYWKNTHLATESEIVLLKVLCDMTDSIWGSMENRKALQLSKQRLESFLQISRIMTSAMDQKMILQMIVDNATRILGLNSGAVYVQANRGKIMLSATTPALPPDFPEQFRYASLKDHPHIAHVFKTGKYALMNDAESEKLTPKEREIIEIRKLHSNLFLPIRQKDKIMGVLILSSQETLYKFSNEEITLLQGYADQAAHEIDKINYLEKLKQHTIELELEINKRKNTELQLEKSLEEKTLLLRELYHRTKNNMQVILSMLKIQSHISNDPRITVIFNDISNKIHAMSMVHQKLYEAEDLSHIELKEYIKDIARHIIFSYNSVNDKIELHYDLEDLKITIDKAVPLGLVLTELISNAFKHAFPNGRQGAITIDLYSVPQNKIILEISNNGVKVKNDNIREIRGMGLENVFTIVEYQLRGSIDWETNNGLKWKITLDKDSETNNRLK